MVDSYGRLPLAFEANDGQTDARVKFLSRGSGHTLFLTSTEAVLASSSRNAVRMRLLGADRDAQVNGLDRLPGNSNYFLGNDPAKWHTNVPTYAKVRYSQIYPGVDLVYYGNQRELEYDFIVAPGANPDEIRLAIRGAQRIFIDQDGNAVLRRKEGDIRLRKPHVYQEIDGQEMEIAGGYLLKGRELRFRVTGYDHHRPLVIDPVLTYATYLGGPGSDGATGVAVDSAGNAYVVGVTSGGFPLSGPEQAVFEGVQNLFISKLNPAGTALIYSTYLGGSGNDTGYAIAVDTSGSAYVTGTTTSSNFPVTGGAFQSKISAAPDAFVTKLSPDGASLVYSSYLGGSANDLGFAIAVDSSGYAYVAGETQSGDFPHIGSTPNVQNPVFCDPANAGGFDGFIAKVTPDGGTLVYSLFLGGSGTDRANGVAVDSSGNAYVAGNTNSTDFLASNCPGPSLHLTNSGGNDAFVVKVNPTGTSILGGRLLGGSGQDAATSIAVDGSGSVYLAGESNSGGAGGLDAFGAKLDSSLGTLYFTYFGGTGLDLATGVAVDS
jgi:hypothetical protein